MTSRALVMKLRWLVFMICLARPVADQMVPYDIENDPSLHCADSKLCTCDDSAEKKDLYVGLDKCNSICLASPACEVIYCVSQGTTGQPCTCHQYTSCTSTRTPSNLNGGVHYKKVTSPPPTPPPPPTPNRMVQYDVEKDPSLHCADSNLCTCDNSAEKVNLHVGLDECNSLCLASPTCDVIYCVNQGSTGQPCTCHQYPSCTSTRTPSNLNGGVHYKKVIPPPPKPTPPSADWPTFSSEADLQNSPWATYFNNLYGELPDTYPLSLATRWCFYMDKMKDAGITAPQSVGQCPTSKDAPRGQRYDENNAYSSKDLTWLWHEAPADVYSGFAKNSIVEVSHLQDPFGDEHHGMWFQYARGSGVWLDVGNSVIFDDHEDAYKEFGATGNEDMCQKAAAAGWDTVQFIKHRDAVNYPCASKIGVDWMNMEIVAVKLVGTYPCGQAQGTAAALRAGWHGDKPCKCDPTNPNTNCVFSVQVLA